MDTEINYMPLVKIKETTDEDSHNDIYCFECHHEGDVISCDSCPRVYHLKCLGSVLLSEKDWTCPECEITQSSLCIINQSTPLQRHSIHEFHIMLNYALCRLKSYHQADYFMQLNDSKQMSDSIIHPMDLTTIQKNINSKKYSSTEAFFGDIKWILHNSIICHGNQSKITANARTLVKIARHEMTEIEICPECYLHGAQPVSTDWFIKPCTIPHTLCWAKMKSYQTWPAKVLRLVNNEVDVRFFGRHDRAWVSLSNCFVLSKEYPESEKKKSNINFERSLDELQRHIEQMKKLYGHFTYAPPQTLLSKTRPFKFVSLIDDSILPSYITAANSSRTFHSSNKHSKQPNSSSESNTTKAIKRSNKNPYEHQQHSRKRARLSSNQRDKNIIPQEVNESQPILNVFDIFNQSDQTLVPIANNHEISSEVRSTSPTDNKLRIQALLRKYINRKSPIIDPITSDVRSSMSALLDAVEAFKSIPEVPSNVSISPANNQIPEQPPRTKKSRKSNLQHRIIQKKTSTDFITCSSLDQSLSPSLPFIPLRPLSVSPPSVDIFQGIPCDMNDEIITKQQNQELQRIPSIEILDVKSTPSTVPTNSFLISPTFNINIPFPTIIPNSEILQKNIWPSVLSINAPGQQSKNKTPKRSGLTACSPTSSDSFSMDLSLQQRSNGTKQSRRVSNIPSLSNQNSIRTSQHRNQASLADHQTSDEIQVIINNFNDQFQHLLVDVTGQIESSLQTIRTKYETDLEETRRSYRLSLNELQSITTKQIQEIHNNLELQYWKRLSEMRNRYESKLQYQ